MNKKLLDDLFEIFEPEIDKLGYELIEIEFENFMGELNLVFYIYKQGGTDLEDTEIVSRYLSDRLDEVDPIEKEYNLVVSSPDLNKPLKTDDDFRRNMGAEVTINLYRKIDNKKEFDGYINNYDENILELRFDDESTKKFERKDISLIKHKIRF